LNPFNFNDYVESRRAQINQALTRNLSADQGQTEILAAMNHSLHAGGKRLRPILCIAACEVAGGSADAVLPACCAIEMVHTYSLIHDDLPAMDDDQLRRGQPTCHIAFGEATAILAGDALVTRAFQLLAEHALTQPVSDQPKWLRVMQHIGKAAGYEGMIEGQMQDIHSEGRRLNLAQLERLHRLKTGAMITAAVVSGAEIGNATREQKAALTSYADSIGLAFQVQDDILNIEGDPEKLGKNIGTDRQRNKNTYPALLGLTPAKSRAEALIAHALRALDIFDTKTESLRAIATFIIERRR
jgi:geranylgeranyl diphosphate synthase type II